MQNKDGSFTGVIKVWVRLKCSMSVPSGGARPRLCSYYQLDTATPLHISSSTQAHDIVHALLSAFGVTDNPGKFALFEHRETSEQGKIIPGHDCARCLCLVVGTAIESFHLPIAYPVKIAGGHRIYENSSSCI